NKGQWADRTEGEQRGRRRWGDQGKRRKGSRRRPGSAGVPVPFLHNHSEYSVRRPRVSSRLSRRETRHADTDCCAQCSRGTTHALAARRHKTNTPKRLQLKPEPPLTRSDQLPGGVAGGGTSQIQLPSSLQARRGPPQKPQTTIFPRPTTWSRQCHW